MFIQLFKYLFQLFNLQSTLNLNYTLLISYSKFDPPYTHFQHHFFAQQHNVCQLTPQGLKLFYICYSKLVKQPSFLADGLCNIWIVKSNESSRGRNLFLIDSIKQAQNYNNGMRLIQKYIQNVWIYSDPYFNKKYPFLNKLLFKKFDIRFWVFVKSISPLQAYIYQQGYLRISKDPYHLSHINKNKVHLTNFSINYKNSDDKNNSYVLWSQFLVFLQREKITSTEKLKNQIQSIVLSSLRSFQLNVNSKSNQNNFQLFGYDIILDGQLRPWLLECNMSPACHQRGQLQKIVTQMGSGLLHLMNFIQTDTYLWKKIAGQTNIKRKQNLCSQNKRDLHFNKNQTIMASKSIKQSHTGLIGFENIKFTSQQRMSQGCLLPFRKNNISSQKRSQQGKRFKVKNFEPELCKLLVKGNKIDVHWMMVFEEWQRLCMIIEVIQKLYRKHMNLRKRQKHKGVQHNDKKKNIIISSKILWAIECTARIVKRMKKKWLMAIVKHFRKVEKK